MTKTTPDIPVAHLLRIHRLWQTANATLARHLQRFAELAERRCAVLAVLRREKNLSQSEVMRRTGIDRSTVSALIAGLVRLGYVTRIVCGADARAHSVNITAKGSRLMARAMPAALSADKEIAGLLPVDVWPLLDAPSDHSMEVTDAK